MFYLFESYKQTYPICCFTLQMAIIAKADVGQNRESETQSCLPHGFRGPTGQTIACYSQGYALPGS